MNKIILNKLQQYANIYKEHSLEKLYECYHKLYLTLKNKLPNSKAKSLLFINKMPMDIDYLAIISELNNKEVYMSGIYKQILSYQYFFTRIKELTENYEFFNFNYQPKYNKINWKINKKEFDKIELIILPIKLVFVGSDKFPYAIIHDKKMYKFLSKFTKAKFVGIGFGFAQIVENLDEYKYKIKLEEKILINTKER